MIMHNQQHFIHILFAAIALLTLTLPGGCTVTPESPRESATAASLSLKQQLGKRLFFEQSLSTPEGQSCSSCHDPAAGFADPVIGLPVSRGAHIGRYGNRNDMPAAYAAFAPPLHYDKEDDVWVGGLFWDGRANTLAEQAKGPPLNPLEMANPDIATVAGKLPYKRMFEQVYGADALTDPEQAYDHMADAIAAYEKSAELSPFTSKFDYYLKGQAQLTEQELRGLRIFEAEDKGNCAACHPSRPFEDGTPPLFTDYTYDNLGVPKNPENPFYLLPKNLNPQGQDFIDTGLGETLKDSAQNGKFRVPTLRNVAITPPYMHNGVFKALFSVVAFYNTRDLADWPAPEVAENVNRDELGNLGLLSNQEMEDLVAFMKTLTDGWSGRSAKR